MRRSSQRLVIADQATTTHAGRIVMKPGLRDWVQVVALVCETGLVTPGEPGD